LLAPFLEDLSHSGDDVAVTFRQIPEFGLEKLLDPSPDVIMKLEGGYDSKKGRNKKGDPNTERFKKMSRHFNNSRVFQVELDAMYARREQFKKLLIEVLDGKPDPISGKLVGGMFDHDIYKKHVLDKLEVERDALTMRLNDKLIHEKIQSPGWEQIEYRINTVKEQGKEECRSIVKQK
jgi:hypothetical protein